MFVDSRHITVSGGKGGDGIVHWRQEKYVAKGGPDGGNGGDGGDLYLIAVRDIHALNNFKENDIIAAEDGDPGKGTLSTGKNGGDREIQVPIGSVVINTETHEQFEIVKEGQKVLVAAGGRGGLGNAHFKSSVNTTPKEFTPGEKPQTYHIHIALHLIADVGLIGLPNAGKSTLLNTITNAQAQVANYPFTTLEPNLAVFYGYVLADIPGLIENASEGKGLGHTFLRHITRTNILVHLVAADEQDPVGAYHTIRKELGAFREELLEKKEIVILSKVDTVSQEVVKKLLSQLPKGTIPLSVLDDELIQKCIEILQKELQSIEKPVET